MKKSMLFIFLVTNINWVSAEPDLQAATDEVCKCLEEPYKIAKQSLEKINQAKTSGDFSELMAAQGNMMAVIDASAKCFDALPGKYPQIDKSEELQNKVMQMAEKQCPNPASQLSVQN